MPNINDSVLNVPEYPEKVRYQIDKYVLSHNSSAPALGKYFVSIGIKFGINPIYAAAQSILETGFFRFGGRAKPEWHNPAGLKCNGEFLKFSSWEQGIHAFYERLNCYVKPQDDTGEGGKYDPCYGHWRYNKLIEMGQKPDSIIGIAHLWLGTCNPQSPEYLICRERAINYTQRIVQYMQGIESIPYQNISDDKINKKSYLPYILGLSGIAILTYLKSKTG